MSVTYKIRARKISSCEDLPSLCRMEISVGQDYHEGEKLKTAIDWAKNKFDRNVILLGDLPQRYNIAFDKDLEINQAASLSIKNGDEWLERNGHLLSGFEVYRWDYFLSHSDYSKVRSTVESLFDNHLQFRTSLMGSIDEIWKRKNLPESRKEEFYNISQTYLLEETAVFAMAYKMFKGISAYPGSFLELWSCFLNNAPEGLEGLGNAHCIRLNFNRKRT